MTMKEIRTAVIGVGNMGKNHARIYAENSNLVSVADLDEELGNSVAKTYGVKFYKDYLEMIRKEKLDAVSVVVPTKYHKDVSINTLKAGIATLLEKPIAINTSEAREILKIQKETKTPLMIGHIERFNPVVRKLKEIIDNNEIGDLLNLLAIRAGFQAPQTKGSDVALDLGIHDIDLFGYLTNQLPESTYISRQKVYRDNETDSAVIHMMYEKINGVIQTNWISQTKIRKIFITGSLSFVEADYINQTITLHKNVILKKSYDNYYDLLSITEGNSEEIKVESEEPLLNELKFFLTQSDKDIHNITLGAYNALEILENSKLLQV